MPRHHRHQPVAPLPLLQRQRARSGVRTGIGAVIAGPHVDAVVRRAAAGVGGAIAIVGARIERRHGSGGQFHQGEVHGLAGGVAGAPRDIAETEQVSLVHLRVVAALRRRFPAVLRPGIHVIDRALRAIAIVDLQRQALRFQLGLHALQRMADRAGDDAFRRLVAFEDMTGEVVGGRIADVLDDARVDAAQVDEASRHGLRGGRRRQTRNSGGDRGQLREPRQRTGSALTTRREIAVSVYLLPGQTSSTTNFTQ